MQFSEAEKKLKAIAGDRYYSLSREKGVHVTGTIDNTYRVYLDPGPGLPGIGGYGKTWEEAFLYLEKQRASFETLTPEVRT